MSWLLAVALVAAGTVTTLLALLIVAVALVVTKNVLLIIFGTLLGRSTTVTTRLGQSAA